MNEGKRYCGLRCRKIFLSRPQPTTITDFGSVLSFYPEEWRKLFEENKVKREFRLDQLSFEEDDFDSISEKKNVKPKQSQSAQRVRKYKSSRRKKKVKRSSQKGRNKFKFAGRKTPKITGIKKLVNQRKSYSGVNNSIPIKIFSMNEADGDSDVLDQSYDHLLKGDRRRENVRNGII